MFLELLLGVSNWYLNACVLIWLVSFFVQAYFYLNFFLSFSNFKLATNKKHIDQVSIIIAAKNESKNLKKLLPLIFQQSHSQFELIIIDDHSSDTTADYLKQVTDKRLKVIQMVDGTGKKAAVKLGIENARNSYFVFTDADCIPLSNNWLSEMIGGFSETHKIVLGHSSFFKTPRFLNKIIRYEAFMVATQYLSFAVRGKAYMGVGRNLAYSRKIYEKSTSFQQYETIQSGDDDLLVNEMATSKNVSIVTSLNGQTKSTAEKSLKKYVLQKRRQLQAGEHYKLKDRLFLAVFGTSTLLFNTCTLILLYLSGNWAIILAIFVSIWLLKASILNKIANELGDRDVVRWSWLLEFCHILLITAIGISTWIWKVDKWK